MNLLCRLPHLHGQSILVDGCVYQIGDNGVAADVFEEHAAVLLEQDTWCAVHPEDLTRPRHIQQVSTRQPEGVEHLILPVGEDVVVPDTVRLETDRAKIVGRSPRKKGKRK